MTTVSDYTTRTRQDIFDAYVEYQRLARRVQDLTDEVAALGGAVGIYGVNGINFPAQGDGFVYADMTSAFTNLVSLIGTPSLSQKQTLIRTRRS